MKKTLKFLSWMFILLLTVSVSSCKDDDEPANGLVGSWNDEGGDDETEVTTFVFNNDNSGKMVSRDIENGRTTEKSFTYTFENAELMIIYGDKRYERYKVVLSGNTMSWTQIIQNELTNTVYFFTKI
ncbi:lipocalin family protein [Paraprevotella xylaniphila]|jgi:hypothetical protein